MHNSADDTQIYLFQQGTDFDSNAGKRKNIDYALQYIWYFSRKHSKVSPSSQMFWFQKKICLSLFIATSNVS